MDERSEDEDIDFWDLDHTILNTEGKLFGPIVGHVAAYVGCDTEEVRRVFDSVCASTFSWQTWFAALQIGDSHAAQLQVECEGQVRTRIESCLYDGVVDLIAERSAVARQVLITAGDPRWQEWKFRQIECLLWYFAPHDRHFVPLNGSKAECIQRYAATSGRKVFTDDSPRWHLGADGNPIPGVLHVRPMWPGTYGTKPHDGDGVHWRVVTGIGELHRLLWMEE